MGNIFTVDLSCLVICCLECTRERAARIYFLKENLENLESAKQELEDIKKDLQKTVSEEILDCLLEDQVEGWIRRAETKTLEVDKLIRDGGREIDRLCCGGHCSKHWKSSYKFGKDVCKRIEEVDKLHKQGKQYVESLLAKRPGDEAKYAFDRIFLLFYGNKEQEPKYPMHNLCEKEQEISTEEEEQQPEISTGEEEKPEMTTNEAEEQEKPVEVVAIYGIWCVIFMCVLLLLVSFSCINIM